MTLINQASIPPRESFVFGIEVRRRGSDGGHALGDGQRAKGPDSRRPTCPANAAGHVTAKLVYDVPLAKVHELLDRLRASGHVRVQRSEEHPEVPDSPLAVARLDVTLSNETLLVASDDGFSTKVRSGLSYSLTALSWSVMILILGLCVLLPWALVIWAIVKLVLRLRRKANPAATAA